MNNNSSTALGVVRQAQPSSNDDFCKWMVKFDVEESEPEQCATVRYLAEPGNQGPAKGLVLLLVLRIVLIDEVDWESDSRPR